MTKNQIFLDFFTYKSHCSSKSIMPAKNERGRREKVINPLRGFYPRISWKSPEGDSIPKATMPFIVFKASGNDTVTRYTTLNKIDMISDSGAVRPVKASKESLIIWAISVGRWERFSRIISRSRTRPKRSPFWSFEFINDRE